MTGSSDVVVRATIENLEYQEYVEENEKEKYRAHLFKIADMRLRVDCCLKGTTDNTIRFTMRVVSSNKMLDDWHSEKTALYWFLIQSAPDKNGIAKLLPRHEDGGRTYSTVHPPSVPREKPPILLLRCKDWEPIKTDSELEHIVVEYALKYGHKRDAGKKLFISKETAAKTNMYGCVFNDIMVPSDFQIENMENVP